MNPRSGQDLTYRIISFRRSNPAVPLVHEPDVGLTKPVIGTDTRRGLQGCKATGHAMILINEMVDVWLEDAP